MAGACGGHFGGKWLLWGPREASASSPPCRLPHVPSLLVIRIHTALMWFPSSPRSVKEESDLGPYDSILGFSDRHQDGFKLRMSASWRSRSFKRCHQFECLHERIKHFKRVKAFVCAHISRKVCVLWCLKSPKIFFLPFGRGAMFSSERELACPATLPQILIPACLVRLVIVNTRGPRCSSLV